MANIQPSQWQYRVQLSNSHRYACVGKNLRRALKNANCCYYNYRAEGPGTPRAGVISWEPNSPSPHDAGWGPCPHQKQSRAGAEGQTHRTRLQLHCQVTDKACPPHPRTGLGSGPGPPQLLVAAPSCRGYLGGLRQTGTTSSPSNWDFIAEAAKLLNELFTSSSMVAKFTGLNPAASPANGALHS